MWRYRRTLFLLTLIGVTAIAGLVWVVAQVPLPEPEPAIQTTVVYDADGAELATLAGAENRLAISLDEIPERILNAVIAAEDRDFRSHGGVDLGGIARALWVDLRNEGRQGGSTITQQYVKNTYVGDAPTLWRKFKEAVVAIKLERDLATEARNQNPSLTGATSARAAKDEILERYLNSVYFGRGAYGIQAASRAYFGREIRDGDEELGLSQTAYLIGLIRSPSVGDVAADPACAGDASGRPPCRAEQLRANVLAAMVDAGYIQPADATAAGAVPLAKSVVAPTEARSTLALKGVGAEYFVEYVRRQLVTQLGPESADRVRQGGLRVYTTLRPEAQKAGYLGVYGLLNAANDPAGALVSLDRTGAVVAMVGGRDFNASEVNLAVGTSGGGEGRQGGSTFKPFLLAETIRRGYSLGSTFAGPAKLVLEGADNGKDWEINNYENTSYGSIDLVEATVNSVNTVYAQLVAATESSGGRGPKVIGPEGVKTMAQDLGVESPLEAVPSIALGTQNVSVLEMAAAYNTFATEGMRVSPRVITKVVLNGQELALDRRPDARVLAPTQARRLNAVLGQVVARGSGVRARVPGTTVRGKTGTSDDFGDAWFVGSTDRLTTAVWMGFPDGRRPMLNIHNFPKVSGGSLPAMAFQRYMTKAVALTSLPTSAVTVAALDPNTGSGRPIPGCCQAVVQEEGEAAPTSDSQKSDTGNKGKDSRSDSNRNSNSNSDSDSNSNSNSNTGTSRSDPRPDPGSKSASGSKS